MSLIQTDPIVSSLVAAEEAERIIRRNKGRSIYLSCSQFAIETEDGNRRTGYTAYSNVRVTKRQALEYMKSAYSPALRAKAKVRVAQCSTCLFIGAMA